MSQSVKDSVSAYFVVWREVLFDLRLWGGLGLGTVATLMQYEWAKENGILIAAVQYALVIIGIMLGTAAFVATYARVEKYLFGKFWQRFAVGGLALAQVAHSLIVGARHFSEIPWFFATLTAGSIWGVSLLLYIRRNIWESEKPMASKNSSEDVEGQE